ncbi:hypothetical protein AGIG_G24974 [Arapaima gigas]
MSEGTWFFTCPGSSKRKQGENWIRAAKSFLLCGKKRSCAWQRRDTEEEKPSAGRVNAVQLSVYRGSAEDRRDTLPGLRVTPEPQRCPRGVEADSGSRACAAVLDLGSPFLSSFPVTCENHVSRFSRLWTAPMTPGRQQ